MPLSWLPDYDHVTPLLLLMYAVAGVFGALVRVAWLDKPLRGIYKDKNGGWRLGFYGEVLVGIAVAILMDGHPVRAGLAAVFGPTILSALQEACYTMITRGKKGT